MTKLSKSSRTLMLSSAAVFALCAATQATAQDAAPTADTSQPATGPARATNDEQSIIVTAERRAQLLIDVPQSVSVISGQTLEKTQAKSFLDYAALVPGLNVTQEQPGESRIILRGINAESVGSTVAVYVDDIPFGQSGSLANGGILAGDFDTFDVQRIEVLRGPQGTLYGSNSLGGVLKFVTNLPNTQRVEARAQAGIEAVNRGELGYVANAMINVPLASTVAFRASGFFHRVPGQVDASGLTNTNIDRTDSYGGRASLLFKPSDDVSVRLFALAQDIRANSPSAFEADPVTLRPVDAITGLPTGDRQTHYELFDEFHNIKYRVYSGTLDYNLGFAKLTSITSYATQQQDQITDISTNAARGLANVVYAPAAPGTVGLDFVNNAGLKKFTEEARLVSPTSTTFDWIAGVYYTNERTTLAQEYLPFTISSQAFIPTAGTFGPYTFSRFVYADINAKYEEIAGYANGTAHFGPRFDLTAGVRYSHNKQSSTQQVIQLGLGDPEEGSSSEGVFTWSIAPRFEINDHAAIYGRVAKGYRPGGPNFIPPGAAPDFPANFQADTLVSYEAGVKAQNASHRVGIDAAVFYVDWDNILILGSADSAAGPVGVNTNGKRARTYGFEASGWLRPIQGLELSANVAFTKANLLDDTVGQGLNLTGGLKGDALPYIPEWSGTLSADYRWRLSDAARAFLGARLHAQSDQKAGFNPAYRGVYNQPINLKGYATVDLNGGVDIGQVTIEAYVRNLFDSDGKVFADYPFTVPADLGGTGIPLVEAVTIRPRTFGATVGFTFR